MSAGRVLVIEDAPGVADVLRRGLALQGLDVVVAEDGTSGREYWAAGGFDLIILDVMLPEIDGLSLCQEIRTLGDRTPVLILSARDEQELLLHSADDGVVGYLVKPFAYAELIRRVATVIPGVSAASR